ncbi:hypothetical protein GCM10022207_64100 [Streptomyces lannensis]|uniref:Uncharacterized protein n=1 Tax=Streptomyces lannensis TaxID=766498 RepID=A0ABP7KWP5_9ACTN
MSGLGIRIPKGQDVIKVQVGRVHGMGLIDFTQPKQTELLRDAPLRRSPRSDRLVNSHRNPLGAS